MTKCSNGCGRKATKYSALCRQCSAERVERAKAEARAIVRGGSCPTCAQPLRRNLALAGWWQCSGFGAEGFRAAGSAPCNFQTFTE